MEYAVEMLNITKEFPGIKANDNITLKLKKGTVHALLGENGSGKSTLMSVLFGLYQPEEGKIKINDKLVEISNPNIATSLGIGMVHQHFKLVHNFTVTENIILGLEPKKAFGRIDISKARKKIVEISNKYNLQVNPDVKIEDISIGMQQRVEILKMLYRNSDILIFDEPTAVLTPDEIDTLMEIIKNLIAEGKSILIITHKLKEIKSIATECTIIRKGKHISTVNVEKTTSQEMADLMVGRSVNFNVHKCEAKPSDNILTVENLIINRPNGTKSLNNISFTLKAGEILAIAGIEGNGQTELVDAITGMKKLDSGKIFLSSEDITQLKIREKTLKGIGHIPSDRHKFGLVLDYTVEENIILQTYFKEPFSKRGFLKSGPIRKQSNELIERFDIRTANGSTTNTRSMSGGNQQKIIIAREIVRKPKLLIAVQPTRGLDMGAIEFIHKELIKARDEGKAILLISLELDEVLSVSDRIIVMHDGKAIGELITSKTNEREIGMFMAGETGGQD